MISVPLEHGTSGRADEEAADGTIVEFAASPVTGLIARGRERGYVTRAELNGVLPPGEAVVRRVGCAPIGAISY